MILIINSFLTGITSPTTPASLITIPGVMRGSSVSRSSCQVSPTSASSSWSSLQTSVLALMPVSSQRLFLLSGLTLENMDQLSANTNISLWKQSRFSILYLYHDNSLFYSCIWCLLLCFNIVQSLSLLIGPVKVCFSHCPVDHWEF